MDTTPLMRDELWFCPVGHLQQVTTREARTYRITRGPQAHTCRRPECSPRLPRSPQERKRAALRRVHRGHYRAVYGAFVAGGMEAAQEVFAAMRLARQAARERYG